MRWGIFFRDIGIILTAIAVGAGSMYGIVLYQQSKAPQQMAQKQADTLLGQVGQLIELPKEIPTVATVSDRTKLIGQPFFNHAKNGDTVLIFKQAGEALLYRSSEHKLITVAPLTIQTTPIPEMGHPSSIPATVSATSTILH